MVKAHTCHLHILAGIIPRSFDFCDAQSIPHVFRAEIHADWMSIGKFNSNSVVSEILAPGEFAQVELLKTAVW
ncbi:MAG TPA: hypothetical protein VJR04_03885 [Terriglobales bacterium]|nr:hypothetical protein [Terriglobales bacterium]